MVLTHHLITNLVEQINNRTKSISMLYGILALPNGVEPENSNKVLWQINLEYKRTAIFVRKSIKNILRINLEIFKSLLIECKYTLAMRKTVFSRRHGKNF